MSTTSGASRATAAIASALEDAVGRRIAAMPISPTELYDLVRSETAEHVHRPDHPLRHQGAPA